MNKLEILSSEFIALFLLALLIFTLIPHNTLSATPATENIYALRIENINRNGADFYWSTSIETKGTIEYAYSKLPQLYNPQSPGSSQNILVTATPLLSKSEDYYLKAHHIRVDNLDVNYDPFVQYTIKSQTFNGETYTLSGEFVLVDTQRIYWWQTWQFAIFMPVGMFVLGLIIIPITTKIWNLKRSISRAVKRLI